MTASLRIDFDRLSRPKFADAHAVDGASAEAEKVQRILDAVLVGTPLSGQAASVTLAPSDGAQMKDALLAAGAESTLYNTGPGRPAIWIEPSQDSSKRQGRFSHR